MRISLWLFSLKLFSGFNWQISHFVYYPQVHFNLMLYFLLFVSSLALLSFFGITICLVRFIEFLCIWWCFAEKLVFCILIAFFTWRKHCKEKSHCGFGEKFLFSFFAIFIHRIANSCKFTFIISWILVVQKSWYFWFLKMVWQYYLKHWVE